MVKMTKINSEMTDKLRPKTLSEKPSKYNCASIAKLDGRESVKYLKQLGAAEKLVLNREECRKTRALLKSKLHILLHKRSIKT